MKYNLASYILSIEPNDNAIRSMFGVISIGGEGSELDNITITLNQSMWSTEGFATGAWVHNKNLDKTGTASINLNQLSNKVNILKRLFNTYYGSDYDGFTLTLTDLLGNKVATCIDCYITTIPSQVFAASASMQSWSFTCGKITFE